MTPTWLDYGGLGFACIVIIFLFYIVRWMMRRLDRRYEDMTDLVTKFDERTGQFTTVVTNHMTHAEQEARENKEALLDMCGSIRHLCEMWEENGRG